MSVTVLGIVVAGAGLSIAAAIATGFDRTLWVIASLIVLVAAVAVAAVYKMRTGAVEPRSCSSCGGVVSRSAPYCKHCGERFPASSRAAQG